MWKTKRPPLCSWRTSPSWLVILSFSISWGSTPGSLPEPPPTLPVRLPSLLLCALSALIVLLKAPFCLTQSHHFGIIATTSYLSVSLAQSSGWSSSLCQLSNSLVYFNEVHFLLLSCRGRGGVRWMTPRCLASQSPDHPVLGLHLCSLHRKLWCWLFLQIHF